MAPEAQRLGDVVEAVKAAKRAGRMYEAEQLLIAEIEEQERQSRAAGWGVAPWYYEQLAIVYAKQGKTMQELEVLERYARQIKAPGARPAKLAERLQKVRKKLGRL